MKNESLQCRFCLKLDDRFLRYDRIHDLSCFIYRTVCNVVHYDDTACLTLRKSPNGEIISGIGWQNGDSILVHGSYSEDGWLLAYVNGIFGYVNGNNVY